MRKGNLRADLFYRIKGVTIEMPPLRDRREDIPALVAYFTSQFTVERGLAPKKFDDAAVNTLIAHDWPGNVRELADAVESLIVLSDSDIIFADDVKRFLKQPSSDATPTTLSARLKDMERTLIIQALQESGCNVAGAARLLGIDRANLHKKIKAHDIDVAGMSG
jgi:DNA-binding NtrC family response regulator